MDRAALRAEITRSLDQIAERGIDPTEAVYARVFDRWPETQALFVRDTDGSARAHMLFEVIEAVLDHAGSNAYARGFIATERVHHVDDLGVSDEAYVGLFAVLRDVVAEALDSEWTPAMASAWVAMIADIAAAQG